MNPAGGWGAGLWALRSGRGSHFGSGRTLLGVAALACVLGGCSGALRPPRVGDPPPRLEDPVAEQHYVEVLERWTRRFEVYSQLDTRLFLAATFQSMEFREAKAARLAAFRSLPQPDVEAMIAAEQGEHARTLDFLVGVHANERRFDDFSRPDSLWRVALATPAGEALPVSIERLPRPDPNVRGLYPYLDAFWGAYLIKFPRTFPNGAQVVPEDCKRVSLRFSSVVGRAELHFDLGPAGANRLSPWP